MPVAEPLSPFILGVRSMVHDDVRHDALRAPFHECFLATRLLGGGAALISFPLYLALWGAPDTVAAIAFAWLMAPIAVALFLSRTGRLEAAQVISAASLTGLLTFLALAKGAPLSVLLPWIVLVPAEAVLTGARRVVLTTTALAALSVAAISAAAGAGLVPTGGAAALPAWAVPLLGALPALIGAGLLAAGANAIGRRLIAAGRDSDSRFRPLAENACDLITRHRRNGNTTLVTPVASRLLGIDPGELLGDGLFRRIHVADRPAYLKALDDAAMGGEGAAEIRVRREEDGGFAWLEMRSRALEGEEAADRDVVAVLRDIGERKAGEHDLAAAFEESERASLAKSRFLARMSHELRTPLNAVIGFSEILSQEMFGKLEQERHREYAELIRDSGRHLLDLINDILDMSKIEAGSFEIFPEPFDLAGLVHSCRQMLAPQAQAGAVTIDTDLPVNLPELVADRRACKQILLNLLHNAVKFSRGGGRVIIGAYAESGSTCIYVADEGIGISRENVRRLGEPFVQVHSAYDRQYEGSGLGLSVVKGLAALHGGHMEIDSEIGAGTRVTIRLPSDAGAAEGAEAAEEPELQRLSA